MCIFLAFSLACELHCILTFLLSLPLLFQSPFLMPLLQFVPETCFPKPILFLVSYTLHLLLSHGVISDTSALATSQFTVRIPCNSQAACAYPAARQLVSLDCELPSTLNMIYSSHLYPAIMLLLDCQLWLISWLSL